MDQSRGLVHRPVTELRRFPLKSGPGQVILLEMAQIFYIEAEGDDSLIRIARKNHHKHVEPLDEVEARFPSPPFFRIHRSYLVNLDRVLELRLRGERDYEVKMDPPVKKVLSVSRDRSPELAKLLDL
jgi:DNA-binding LytR/AlgR family response regulator